MNAIIYCRVSTKEQSDQGHSLKAQEKECRALAAAMGYEVLDVFVEEGESAKTVSRTQLTLMLSYLKRKKGIVNALIVWDIDRLSRNPRDYYELEDTLKQDGIKILTVQGTNDTTPIGKLVRSISVSLSEFENEQKRERVTAGMKQALEQGRWPWKAPMGYMRGKSEHGTGNLIPDPEKSQFIIEAFRMMETGDYSQAIIIDRLEDQGFRISPQTLNKILHNPIYCGLLRSDFFPDLLPGNHEPLVSKATFMMVRKIMEDGRATTTKRSENPDFPLRRFISCRYCGSPYTGGYSRGRGGRYAYYRCRTHGCTGNIRKKVLEHRFKTLLETLEPSDDVYDIFEARLMHEISSDESDTRERMAAVSLRLQELREQKTALLKKLASGVIGDDEYNEFISGSQDELIQLQAEEEILSQGRQTKPWKETLEHTREIMQSLRQRWEEANPDQRIQLQNTVFPGGLIHDGQNILNPGNLLLLDMLGEIDAKNGLFQNGPKKDVLNPATSLHSKKIPALVEQVSTYVPPRGIEPLFPP